MVQSPTAGALSRSLAVLWDLDGVLVDTRAWHYASWKRVLSGYGKDLSEKEFRASFGRRNPETIPGWVPGVSEREVREISDRKEQAFRDELPDRIPLLPGVERLSRELARAGVRQAVASSAPRENLNAMLPRMGLKMDAAVSGEDVSKGKPDPDVFLKAAELLSVPPRQCVVVEDAVAGVEAAHRAGMACVAVANTWPAAQLAKADLVVDSLERVSVQDLVRLIDSYHSVGKG